jgi:hypothetical protein
MIEGGEDSLVDLGNFATAVKAKQGATTDIDRGLNTNALLKLVFAVRVLHMLCALT